MMMDASCDIYLTEGFGFDTKPNSIKFQILPRESLERTEYCIGHTCSRSFTNIPTVHWAALYFLAVVVPPNLCSSR